MTQIHLFKPQLYVCVGSTCANRTPKGLGRIDPRQAWTTLGNLDGVVGQLED